MIASLLRRNGLPETNLAYRIRKLPEKAGFIRISCRLSRHRRKEGTKITIGIKTSKFSGICKLVTSIMSQEFVTDVVLLAEFLAMVSIFFVEEGQSQAVFKALLVTRS